MNLGWHPMVWVFCPKLLLCTLRSERESSEHEISMTWSELGSHTPPVRNMPSPCFCGYSISHALVCPNIILACLAIFVSLIMSSSPIFQPSTTSQSFSLVRISTIIYTYFFCFQIEKLNFPEILRCDWYWPIFPTFYVLVWIWIGFSLCLALYLKKIYF